MFGQILHQNGSRSASLNFIVLDENADEKDLTFLWDYLSAKAGEMGACNVQGQLEENSPLIETFRKSGFVVYGWETAWKFPGQIATSSDHGNQWKIATPSDEPQIRALYQSLVPPIVQSAETYQNGGTRRLVYREKEEIVAYIESSHGPVGLYLKPLIHPAVQDVDTLLREIVNHCLELGEPVYLQVRSYQAWLLDALNVIGGESSAHFALLVKHLAIMQRNGVTITQRNLVENRRAEPSAPIVQNLTTQESPLGANKGR